MAAVTDILRHFSGNLGQDPYKVTDTQEHDLGDCLYGERGAVWTYVKFGTAGATGQGYAVTIDADYEAIMVDKAKALLGNKIAFSMAAATAGQYGWVQCGGIAAIFVIASTTANTQLHTNATDGILDDAGTTTEKVIEGAVLTEDRAATNGLAVARLIEPKVGATL